MHSKKDHKQNKKRDSKKAKHKKNKNIKTKSFEICLVVKQESCHPWSCCSEGSAGEGERGFERKPENSLLKKRDWKLTLLS
jgi:hypothetical protein